MTDDQQAASGSTPTAATGETVLWKGPSSTLKDLWVYVFCILLCWLLVPIFIALWKYFENRCRVYEITTERIRRTTGLFTKVSEELELYRVADFKVVEPFWLRIFGLGNITLTTNDASAPNLIIEAVPHVAEVREHLRQSVEACRDRKRVRLTEIE